MSNGFTNLPTSLLGAVSIGGNLVVQGTTRSVGALSTDASLAVGVTPNITRVGSFTGKGPGISGNLGFDAATRDNAGVTAALLALGANGNAQQVRRLNAAGTTMDAALAQFFGTDFTVHANPSNTTENTIYTKTIPAGLLGANGGFVVELAWQITVESAGTNTIRVKLGGTTLISSGVAAVNPGFIRLIALNKNAQNAQFITGYTMLGVTLSQPFNTTAAVDTSVDQALTVTLQMGNAGNACELDMVSIQEVNSFGPV